MATVHSNGGAPDSLIDEAGRVEKRGVDFVPLTQIRE